MNIESMHPEEILRLHQRIGDLDKLLALESRITILLANMRASLQLKKDIAAQKNSHVGTHTYRLLLGDVAALNAAMISVQKRIKELKMAANDSAERVAREGRCAGFVEASKHVLDKDTYIKIWDKAHELGLVPR